MELMSYQNRKEDIRNRLRETVENFVYIGFLLKQVKENEEYKQDGYSDIVEFANQEYGLSRDDTYRFIRINTRYSVGGNSAELDAPYKGIAQSKLSEMLSLPDNDLELITPDTGRTTIRELNNFNRQEPDEVPKAAAGAVEEIIKEFFRPAEGRPDVHDMLRQLINIETGAITSEILTKEELIRECINPNGNGTFRKGRYMLFMYDAKEGMKYKVFGDNENHKLTYAVFAKTAHLLFCAANPRKEDMDEWESFYGKEPEKPQEQPKPEQKEVKPEPPKPQPKPETKIPQAPINTGVEDQSATGKEEQIPQDVDNEEESEELPETIESYPQKKPENEPVAPAQLNEETKTQEPTEIIENPYKEYKDIAAMSIERIEEELHKDSYASAYKAGKELLTALEQMVSMQHDQNSQLAGQMELGDYGD